MRLDDIGESSNVEDRRGSSGGGGGGGFGLGGRSIGIGTIVIALIGGAVFGINPLTILGVLSGGGVPEQQVAAPRQAPPATPPGDPAGRFMSQVLRTTEEVWTPLFQQNGGTYRAPKLVLFRGAYPTACGTGQAAMGPFYCPADQKIYIDLSFYDTLKNRLGAPGDFAQAYVIAHEVGHHVQQQLGISQQVDEARRTMRGAQANQLSVRVELQADCFAGIWANRAQSARKILEQGDIEEAMNAAAKIGDDALQRQAGGAVVPDSFTHGTSAQRQRWFNVGLQNGTLQSCDTFRARQL